MYKVSRRKSAKWNIFFQYYNILFSIVWGLVLVPLYLRYIPINIYGAWLATGNIVAWLTILDPGINDVERQTVSKCYGENNLRGISPIFFNSLILSIIISVLIFIVGYFFSYSLASVINLSDPTEIEIIRKAFVLAVLGSALTILSFHFRAFNHALLSSVGIGIVDVLATLFSLIFTIVFLIMEIGIYAIPLGIIIRALIYIIGNIIYTIGRYIKESIPFYFSTNGILSVVKLTSYNVVGRLGYVFYQNIDSFLVARYLGVELTPILYLTKKASDILSSVVNRPILSVIPIINNAYSAGEKDKVSNVLYRYSTIAIWVMGLFFCGLSILNKSFVELWVGEKMYGGLSVNIFICLLFITSLISNISSSMYFGLGKIKESSLIGFFQSAISIIGMYFGVKYYGIIGIVISQFITQLLISFWYFPSHLSKLINLSKEKIHAIKIESIKVLCISSILLLLLNKINTNNWVIFFSYCIALGIIYFILLFILSKPFRDTLIQIFSLVFNKQKSKK